MSAPLDPAAAAVELLRRAGIAAEVAVAGADGEIAAVSVPPAAVHQLAELAPEIKALGFRYVTVELLPDGTA
jgi:hypothetical protein